MFKISRREFVRISALTGAATVAAACANPTATPAPEATTAPIATTAPTGSNTGSEATPTTAASISSFSEAPMLAELVASGDLPPVEDRLPENPVVLPVKESLGVYGGTWRRAFRGTSDATGMTYLNWNSLTRFNEDLTIAPMLAESWDMNEDATVWTWHLRKGTKWSDGTPLTTEHTQWWWDNFANDKELNPAGIAAYKTGSGDDQQMCELSVEDDFTFIFTFAHPNPLFGFKVIWREFPMMPGYYLEQFHPTFTDEGALEAMITEEGYSSWVDFFEGKRQEHTNPEVPRLDVWLYTNDIVNELVITERNPYCWMVDEEGNQLPYIDYVNYRLYETPDVLNMWLVNGEIDLQARNVDVGNFTLLKENEADGNYQVVVGVEPSHVAVSLNLTSQNEVLRKFFNERDVRFALNFAVNREELNELVYDGLMTPRQYSPVEKSAQFYPDQAFANIEFDPDKANDLLDGAGYDQRDSEGYRVDPDTGETVFFAVEGIEAAGTPYEDAMQLIVKYYGDVGVKCAYKYTERSLYESREAANEMDCGSFSADRTVMPFLAGDNDSIFTGTNTQRPWACAWALWHNNPEDPNGQEPPADHWILDMWNLWNESMVEPDSDTRNELFFQILDIWKEEMPMQGYLGEMPALAIMHNDMRNYAAGYPIGWLTHGLSLLNASTFYFENGAEHNA